MIPVQTDFKAGIISQDGTVGGDLASGLDVGPIGPTNRLAMKIDANTAQLYNNLSGGLVQAKMVYPFVYHLKRNDTLNTGFVSEKMITGAIKMTYKEATESKAVIGKKITDV